MTDKQYVGAIDQGATSARFVVFDQTGAMAASHQVEHRQIYPEPGFVEHDPMEIRANTAGIIAEALKKGLIEPDQIAAVGITNQRETAVVWNRHTGRPLYNAIMWQDTRTADMCTALKQEGHEPLFKKKAMFGYSIEF